MLISRLDTNGYLYAIERVTEGVYALCKLADWVTEHTIRALVRSCGEVMPPAVKVPRVCEAEREVGTDHWWMGARCDLSTRRPASTSRPRSVRLSMKPSMARKQDSTVSELVPQSDLLVEEETQDTLEPPSTNNEEINAAPPTIQEVLEPFRTQYLDSLYVLKTSVAYFAKGPLSRLRNAFQSDHITSADRLLLVEFVRDSILPLKKMDQKYKDTLADLIKDIARRESEGDQSTAQKSKKRRKRQMDKVGKNGLYAIEDDFVAKWWVSRHMEDGGASSRESGETGLKKQIADLRTRETQLQILLILETMTLEAIPPRPGTPIKEEPPDTAELPAIDPVQTAKQSKIKKVQDLKTILELLVDRLCIWQSVDFEEDLSQAKANKKAGYDRLRDFCVEVIIPFYASRLPEQCKSLSNKLGGPKAPSPHRPPLAKAASASQVLPGTAIKRKPPPISKPKRSLQRVLTDEKLAAQTRPTTLSRASTGPSIPGLKREASLGTMSQLASRGGIQKPVAKRSDNREVDLNAVAKAREARLKKLSSMTEQAKQLDAAINALRKPNRQVVVSEFVDELEQRKTAAASKSTSSSRKSKNPTRNPFGQGVQVMATPKKNRQSNIFSNHVSRVEQPMMQSPEQQQDEPPSSISQIPSSVARPPFGSSSHSQPVNTSRLTLDGLLNDRRPDSVGETPTRGPGKRLPLSSLSQPVSRIAATPTRRLSKLGQKAALAEIPEDEEDAPGSSPPIFSRRENDFLAGNDDSLPATPSRKRRTSPAEGRPPVLLETPVKRPKMTFSDRFTATGSSEMLRQLEKEASKESSSKGNRLERQREQEVEDESTIYATLGWDDDIDDLA